MGRLTDEDRRDLEQLAAGAFKYNAIQHARLAYVCDSILREQGIDTAGATVDDLAAHAKRVLAM